MTEIDATMEEAKAEGVRFHPPPICPCNPDQPDSSGADHRVLHRPAVAFLLCRKRRISNQL